MNTKPSRFFRLATGLPLVAGLVLAGSSCTTTYDSYGRPVQSVDPGLAVAGAAAAGLVGYAVGQNNDNHRHGYSGYRGGYRGGYHGGYHGGYRGGYYRY